MTDSEKVEAQPRSGDGDMQTAVSGRPPHYGQSAGQYISTRLTTLKPPLLSAPNPFRLLAKITGMQWCFFAVSFFAWVSTNSRSSPRERLSRLLTQHGSQTWDMQFHCSSYRVGVILSNRDKCSAPDSYPPPPLSIRRDT